MRVGEKLDKEHEAYFNKVKYKLFHFLKYCFNHIPYYKELHIAFPEHIEDFTYAFFLSNIPVLDKRLVRSHSFDFISPQFAISELVKETTSGSEGVPITCYKSRNVKLGYTNALWRLRCSVVNSLSPIDRHARFYARMHGENNALITDPICYRKGALFLSLLDLSKDRLLSYWDEILHYKPKYLLGPVTAVLKLAQCVEENHDSPVSGLQLIELSSEYVEDYQSHYISRVFNCPVSIHYGMREFWTLGYGVSSHQLEILDEFFFIETNENKEILVTSFYNAAWGLIRYNTGDIGNLIINDCDHPAKIYLDLVKGRKSDQMQLKNGRVITPVFFSSIFLEINKNAADVIIQQYQVRLTPDKSLHILLCLNMRNNSFIIRKRIVEFIEKTLGTDNLVNIEFVEHIPVDPQTGKYKEFINLGKESV